MPGAAVISVAFATLMLASNAAPAEESVWSKRRSSRPIPTASGPPPSGEYTCFLIGIGGSVVTPYGAAATPTPMPSAVDRLILDGKGSYRHPSGSGRYRYEPSDGRIHFESGPLAGWSTRAETDGRKQWLRFAPKVGAPLAPRSSIGDHICSLD